MTMVDLPGAGAADQADLLARFDVERQSVDQPLSRP